MMEQVDFQGVCRRERSFGGFTLTESRYGPEDSLPLHAHADPFFALLLAGSYTERLEGGERQCAPSSLAYYPAGIPHADSFDGHGGRAFLVEFRPGDLEEIDGPDPEDAGHLGAIRDTRLNLLALRLYAAFLRPAQSGEIEAEECGLEMLAELGGLELGRERHPPAWLNRVIEAVRANFRSRLLVSDLAVIAGVHPVHLTRVFRRFQGCSIGDYVERLRVQHACPAIVASREPLSMMAVRLGYADQAHFTRRFGKSVGITPGLLRRLASP